MADAALTLTCDRPGRGDEPCPDAGLRERRGAQADARVRRGVVLESVSPRALAQGSDVGEHARRRGDPRRLRRRRAPLSGAPERPRLSHRRGVVLRPWLWRIVAESGDAARGIVCRPSARGGTRGRRTEGGRGGCRGRARGRSASRTIASSRSSPISGSTRTSCSRHVAPALGGRGRAPPSSRDPDGRRVARVEDDRGHRRRPGDRARAVALQAGSMGWSVGVGYRGTGRRRRRSSRRSRRSGARGRDCGRRRRRGRRPRPVRRHGGQPGPDRRRRRQCGDRRPAVAARGHGGGPHSPNGDVNVIGALLCARGRASTSDEPRGRGVDRPGLVGSSAARLAG